MPKFVIERNIPGAGNLSSPELHAISQKSCGVLKEMGSQIQWVQSYVTDDKIYCVYIAPTEAMVREHAKQGLGFLLEGPQHAQHSPNKGYRELKLPHFESQRKVEQIARREHPAAAPATSVAHVGYNDLLVAQVNQLVLGDAQGLGGLGKGERHDRYYLPLPGHRFKLLRI